ncbi:hypothetical protein K505DRAFT_365485 [Melanomma pulvis-pyrius CBS 109.77]|uniref:Uncharacterized protein n=1 Tax=Melanomma pulvis-pyrius CBS 109.77 TaxID=1314802 RepID=A0A6A6X056_9PLEO|nr:hypothetical protein K505DRAFT_365485 [Melanomma pulvis-pyrius CBS 109.77]
MDADPFDPWYTSQLTTEGGNIFKAEDWKFFTINHDADSADVQEQQISVDEIDDWVARRPLLKSPGIDLLLARHKTCGITNTSYQCMPLAATHFASVFEALSLPPQYFHLRATAGVHCNAFTCQTYRDAHRNLSRTSLVVRIGHGSSKVYGSIWVSALAWDAHTSRTVGFIEGMSPADLKELKFHIKSCSQSLGHPLMLPEILLHMITT